MSSNSKIEWTDATWNVTAGCTKCSPGCENCYAERMAYRLAYMGQDKYQGVVHHKKPEWTGHIFCDESVLDKPLHWREPRRIFVCSMSDLFHPKVPFEFIYRVLNEGILAAPRHTYLILTKRVRRMAEFIGDGLWSRKIHLGVSISTPDEIWKATELKKIPTAVRWISFEPLLEDVGVIPLEGIHWVVVGVESGPGARYCPIENIRGIVEQYKAASVPVFVKQIHLNGKAKAIKDINQFPEDLRIQQYPDERSKRKES